MDSKIELKKYICDSIIIKLEKDLSGMILAQKSTTEQAQSEDFKAESKWDTRAIEAGYLAGAQTKRVKELELEILNLKKLRSSVRAIEDVSIGALVVANSNEYFITAQSGGFKVEVDNKLYCVISINSPLAMKLIEEEIEIESID